MTCNILKLSDGRREAQASTLRVGGRDPPDFWLGGRGGLQGVVGVREILVYLIMYRKYVRKW